MTFEAFQTTALNEIRSRFPDSDLSLRYVPKLQGQSYHGLSIGVPGSGIAANINLDLFFGEYLEHRDLERSLDRLGTACSYALAHTPKFNTAHLTDYDRMKHRLSFRMISVKANRKRLDEIPHRIIGDMAAVCYMDLSEDEDSSAGFLVTRGILRSFGRTEEELFADAAAFAPDMHPAVLRPMAEMLGFLGEDPGPADAAPLYVAGFSGAPFGAGVLMYPGFPDSAARKLKGDFYIIPSSVHELILVPERTAASAKDLNRMIAEVNASEVEEEERLSDQAYHYSAAEHRLETALEYEARSCSGNRSAAPRSAAENRSLL